MHAPPLLLFLAHACRTPNRQELGHSPLDTRLAQTRNDERLRLLVRRATNGEELRNGMLRAVGLLDQVDGDAPPGEQGAEHPKVGGDLYADVDAAAVGEEAAGDGGAGGEGDDDADEDEITRCGGDGL